MYSVEQLFGLSSSRIGVWQAARTQPLMLDSVVGQDSLANVTREITDQLLRHSPIDAEALGNKHRTDGTVGQNCSAVYTMLAEMHKQSCLCVEVDLIMHDGMATARTTCSMNSAVLGRDP